MVCLQELDPFGSFCCTGIWSHAFREHVFSLLVSSVTMLLGDSTQNEEFESVKSGHTDFFSEALRKTSNSHNSKTIQCEGSK